MKKAIIIGGGISGLCTAYYLTKEGFQVTVIDKGDLTQGASNINAGYTAPSHILSLASPGTVNKGLRWMWNSASPLYIKPRLNLDFLDWAWKFKKSATAQNVERAVPTLKTLLATSRDLYEAMLEEMDFKSHYEKKGLLTVFTTQKSKIEETKLAERIQKEGLEVELLSSSQLLELEPELTDQVLGAVYYKSDSHSTPNEFINKLVEWLRQKNVTFHLNEDVQKIIVRNKMVTGIKTKTGIYEADTYVLAAGSWSQKLARNIGIHLPVMGGKGYSIDVFRKTGINIPTILAEAKVAITPMRNFTRFSGTMEFSGQNDIVRKKRVSAIADAARTYYKNIALEEAELKTARTGLRPVSPDGLPFIGKTPKYNNLIVATGHAMIGWSLGAVTGELVTQLATNQKTSVDLKLLQPDRFQIKGFGFF